MHLTIENALLVTTLTVILCTWIMVIALTKPQVRVIHGPLTVGKSEECEMKPSDLDDAGISAAINTLVAKANTADSLQSQLDAANATITQGTADDAATIAQLKTLLGIASPSN